MEVKTVESNIQELDRDILVIRADYYNSTYDPCRWAIKCPFSKNFNCDKCGAMDAEAMEQHEAVEWWEKRLKELEEKEGK